MERFLSDIISDVLNVDKIIPVQQYKNPSGFLC